jgi:autotransporter-associated beta strand protein
MKTLRAFTLLAGISALVGTSAFGATILSDNFNVTGSGSGFNLNAGINSGINPPTTRITGSAAAGLRYINTGTKATTAYTITSSKAQIASAANPGRFVLSSDGTNPFDLAPALGGLGATPATPVVYDVSISVKNNSSGIQRTSFALGVAESDANSWDFGFQVYRTASGNNNYVIGKRIDTKASGLASDLNSVIYTMGASTYGTEITVLMRVTDAGSESSGFHSRVQLSLNGGSTWIYDTDTDSDLTSGWRLNGAGRVLMCDIAPSAGPVTYDNFSVNWISGPRTWTGGGANGNWSTAANWGGAAPVSGSQLIFNGTTRQVNTNDISGLSVPLLCFNNGGFSLNGNNFTNTASISNLAGINTLNGALSWSTTGAKTWSIASGSELVLNNTTTIGVIGDHAIVGGGILRTEGTMNFTANPVFAVNEGTHIIDGGTLNTIGGYRVGSLATGSGAQTILTNGASLTITAGGGGMRVGNSANPVASRLDINNSTLAINGGAWLALPYAADATGIITQTGGTVSGCAIIFSEGGAGTGSYTINSGTLVAKQISEANASGTSSMYFNNAILRTESGASSAFMTGLDTAEIQSGGLTIDATTADITIGQVLSGSGALTKTGSNKITLTGANTFTGNTTISAGTLALGSGGAIASPTITIANGTTFDVSGSGSSLGASQTLARNATSGSGTVSGTLSLNSGAKISLQADGTGGTIGTLSVSGGLTLNNNTISIGVSGAPLGAGTYTLVSYTGSKSGSFSATPTITGSGLQSGFSGKIVEAAGQISLKVSASGHGIPAVTLKVVEHDLANTTNSVTVTTTTSINGLQVRDGSSRGDYTVQVGTSATDDFNAGVMLTSVAENGRDHGEDSGTNFCTSSINFTSSGYFIPTENAPAGKEYNINVAAAYFSYARWLGGYARNSGGVNGGANDVLTSSAGINLGTQFVDNGDGTSTIDLSSFGINSQTDGVLLVNAGANNNHYAMSKANSDGTWTVFAKLNSTNGAVYSQSPIAFAYIPKTDVSVISGKINGDGSILMYSGDSPAFSVSTNLGTGIWQLTVPGYSPSSGVLIISPEGGSGANADNIISYQASGSTWLIQSRDLPGLGLQSLNVPLASFVFIPAPTIALVSPANGSSVSSSPTLKVTPTNPGGGNVSVTFFGHNAGKLGPGKDFLIPVLPDTQNYAREASGSGDATKEMWFAQTDWIIDHRFSDNIPFVATLGDCVNNADTLSQWKNATNAYYRLETQSGTQLLEGIPYLVTVGNHDQAPNGDEDGETTYYNQFFGSSHFNNKSYYGGHYSTNNDSWYATFDAGNLQFLVISFEFGRYGSGILDWARDIMAANPTRRTIVLTHFAGQDVADVNATTCPFGAQGQAIYTGLKTNANFFLMCSGHVFDQGGEGRRTDTYAGHSVHTLVSDYQGRFNGGNGLMRLMYFSPSNNTVSVKTYSPYTDNYEVDANSQFSFTYNMKPNGAGTPPTAYAAVGTNLNVASGTQTSITWSGLSASQNYEWFVVVTNEAGDYATSTEWAFSTTSGFSRPANDDANADGIADAWETQNKVTDASADNDGDGQSNLAEYIAKTDPNDAGSTLKIIDATRDADGHVTLKWATVGGVRYRVQYSEDAVNFVDIERDAASETDASPAGEASTQTFTDTENSTNTLRFYRVKVVP